MVSCEFDLYQLNDLNVVEQVVDVTMWVGLHWFNEKVSWDPSKYEGRKRVDFTEKSDMWMPDVVFYNQIDGAPLTKELMAPYRLYNTGETYFSQSIRSSFLCPLDASYFPFDEHVCSLKFGPWTYNTEECDVEGIRLTMNFLLPNTVWEVLNLSSKHVCEDYGDGIGNFSAIIYSIRVRRRSQFYVANIIIPSVAISYLTVFNFIIPCEAGEKISYGVTIFLSQTVNLMLVSELMPRGGKSVPILGQYLLTSIIFIVLCLLTTIEIISIYANPFPENAIGQRKLKFILKRLTPIMGPKLPRKMKKVCKVNPEIETAIANLHVNGNAVLKEQKRDPKKTNGQIHYSTKTTCNNNEEYQKMTKREEIIIACETLNRFGLFCSFTFLTVLTFVYIMLLTHQSGAEPPQNLMLAV
ncbi:acetylcholine receptor subunit beta-like 2 isoform X2 [Symsagittifera roscoffensis]